MALVCDSEWRTALYHQVLEKEKVEPAEILLFLNAQYGQETLQQFIIGATSFLNSIANRPHGHVNSTAGTGMIIRRIEQVILKKTGIKYVKLQPQNAQMFEVYRH